jgi:circadian clock protein KaiC
VRGVIAAVETLRPQRVVFDSLSEMRLLAQDPLRYRRQVLALKKFFPTRAARCCCWTTAPAATRPAAAQHRPRRDQPGAGGRPVRPERRRLRVLKMRGIKFRGGDHDFVLDTGGLSVFPRLVAAEHRCRTARVVSTGVAKLDELHGRRPACGSNTLFSGPPAWARRPRRWPARWRRCGAASAPPTTCSTKACRRW